MARSSSLATTMESTPPERPSTTPASPTCSRTRATVSSMNEPICQSPLMPQNLQHEVAEHVAAALGVRDLRVELDAVELLFLVADRGIGRVGRSGQHVEAGPRAFHAIAVTHPDRRRRRRCHRRTDRHLDRCRVARGRIRDGPRPRPGRRAGGTSAACRSRCPARGCRDRRSPGRSAARPSAYTLAGPPVRMMPARALEPLGAHVVRDDLAIALLLAHATRDELRVLRAEVEDVNGLVGH